MINLLKTIIPMDELELLEFCKNELNIDSGNQYLYKQGSIPILFVAHLDTVHSQRADLILYDKEQQLLWSPQGIGGDDRCGVAMILSLAKKYDIGVLFTTGEEIGGIGATAASKLEIGNDYNFMIELDRNGADDAVFYNCGNAEFHDYIAGHNFIKKTGTFSDICKLSPKFDLASVNLSCGYYREHSLFEIISYNIMMMVFKKVINIIEDYTERGVNIRYDYCSKYYALKKIEYTREPYPCTDCENFERDCFADPCVTCEKYSNWINSFRVTKRSDKKSDKINI